MGHIADILSVKNLKKTNELSSQKANIDGYYSDLTAGNAEQLVATKGAQENTPYTIRKTGGDISVNDRVAEELVGGTVAWNQMAKNTAAPTSRNGMTITGGENGFTIDGTASASVTMSGWFRLDNAYPEYLATNGHKMLVSLKLLSGSITPASGNTYTIYFKYSYGADIVSIGESAIIAAALGSTTTSMRSYLDITNGTVFANAKIGLNCIDLTQMFGSTIANYIYSLETAHAGDGVAFFRSLFPKSYYAYDAGSLQSVQAAKHITTGFNQWDEEWEVGGFYSADGTPNTETNRIRSKNYIPVIGGATYYVAGARITWFEYDANKTYLRTGDNGSYVGANATFVPSSDCSYIRFQTASAYGNVYHNDICINLSDASRNGEYEAYSAHEYPLGEVTLRGIPKLQNGKLYYDGDTYESDGTVTRKYGIIDLGTLTWTYVSTGQARFISSGIGTLVKKPSANTVVANVICVKYNTTDVTTGLTLDKVIGIYSDGDILVRDSSYSDAATFKTAMSGVYLVYELATPTTEESDPFTSPQVVDGAGTEIYEEFGTRDVAVPVGHNSVYTVNLRKKLEDAPDNPSADGDYVVRHEDGENVYVPGSLLFNKNGEYDGLTAGNAKQLQTNVGVDDQVPYNFRTSGGSADIGDRETDKLVGGTVAWNQLGRFLNRRATPPCWGCINEQVVSEDAHQMTITGAHNYSYWFMDIGPHKLFTHFYITALDNSATYNFQLNLAGNIYTPLGNNPLIVNTRTEVSHIGIYKGTSGGSSYDSIYIYPDSTSGTNLGKIKIEDFMIFDLTQMFGSTIADYIYGLETAHAGDGVAWFKSLFPKAYYPYNAGELMHVKTSAHKMREFNAWDEEWEAGGINTANGENQSYSGSIRSKNYIPILPNETYYMKTPANLFPFFYDENKNYIGFAGNGWKNLAKVPANLTNSLSGGGSFANARYMRFRCDCGSTYANDINLNLSWDGERDGEYEPYEEHVYPLDSDLVLRGIPKLDSNNKLYYDGDTYEDDGTVTRKYGIVDLGTLDWTKQTSSAWNCFSASLQTKKNGAYNMTCAKYAVGVLYNNDVEKVVSGNANNQNVYIRDSVYEDAAAFKTAMSGVYLVYELATPTTEEADPFINPQIVDDFGTEEYVDERTVPIPVGHETFYAANLKAKLEMAPDSPGDGNGDYIVRQTNGENEYVKLVIPEELPTKPTTDGNYILKCTVASGTPTLSWVSAD